MSTTTYKLKWKFKNGAPKETLRSNQGLPRFLAREMIDFHWNDLEYFTINDEPMISVNHIKAHVFMLS